GRTGPPGCAPLPGSCWTAPLAPRPTRSGPDSAAFGPEVAALRPASTPSCPSADPGIFGDETCGRRQTASAACVAACPACESDAGPAVRPANRRLAPGPSPAHRQIGEPST